MPLRVAHEVHRYGPLRSQVADLWRPAESRDALPVVVLIHGGFWRARYSRQLMTGLAAALVRQRWAVWNIEYRRVGEHAGGGWPTTLDDVAMAIDALATLEGIDLRRVVSCGHSAGGQLALWAAARPKLPSGAPGSAPSVELSAAVSLAGVVDLEGATDLGRGAVVAFLGGRPDEVPERYASASPARQLPLGVPQLLVHGELDDTVPPSLSEQYVARARAAGDTAELLAIAGAGHLDVINPRSAAWTATSTALAQLR